MDSDKNPFLSHKCLGLPLKEPFGQCRGVKHNFEFPGFFRNGTGWFPLELSFYLRYFCLPVPTVSDPCCLDNSSYPV